MDFTNFFGLKFYSGNLNNLLDYLQTRLREGKKTHIVTMNPEIFMRARRDPEYQRVVKEAELIVVDGWWLAYAIRWISGKSVERIAGIQLAQELLKCCESSGISVFLLGSKNNVVSKACEKLKGEYPNLSIAGYHHGYFTDEETKKVVEEIKASGARVLLVGMGAPKQELFIAKNKQELPCVIMIGVGGSFEVFCGDKKLAPASWQKAKLEWLYRAIQDPTRWARLVKFVPAFVWLILVTKLRGKVH